MVKTRVDGKILEAKIGWLWGDLKVYYDGQLVQYKPVRKAMSSKGRIYAGATPKCKFKLNEHKIEVVTKGFFWRTPMVFVDGILAQKADYSKIGE